MKELLLCALIIISLNSVSQVSDTIPLVDGERKYEEVVVLDSGYSKAMLFKNSKLYFVDLYKSAKDVIQLEDQDAGKIIGKGFFSVSEINSVLLAAASFTWDVYYTTEITCKDGKYRYRLYNISIKQTVQGDNIRRDELTVENAYFNTRKGFAKKLYTRLYNKMIAEFKSTQLVLKDYMKKTAVSTKDDF